MTRVTMVGLAWVVAVGSAVGQAVPAPRVPAPIEQLPPMSVPPADVPAELMPNGTAVSQPLRPVVLEPNTLPSTVTEQVDPTLPRVNPGVRRGAIDPGPALPGTWYSGEYLLSWVKPERLPPLATANRFAVPTLDHPATQILLGGRVPDAPNPGGGRFVLGWAVGGGNRTGIEVGYHFLGTHTATDTLSGGGRDRVTILGRPIVNPTTGREDVVLISHPNMLGEFKASQTVRVQGWELTGLANLYNSDPLKLHALVGYRYFMANEGFRADQQATYYATLAGSPPQTILYRSAAADQIDAHNRFHGAQLGLRTELSRGGFFAQVDTRVSLGRSVQVVKISGQTVGVAELTSGPQVSYLPNGVFGQPSNSGRFEKSQFAVLPEAGVRLGYELSERSRFFVGYNFLYVSRAVRAADQIDRVVDLSQTAQTAVGAGVRPEVAFDRSDLWVQGISFGLEWRY